MQSLKKKKKKSQRGQDLQDQCVKKEAHWGEIYILSIIFLLEEFATFCRRWEVEKPKGRNYKEVDKSAEYLGNFPELGRTKFKLKVAKALVWEETKFLREGKVEAQA